MCTVTTPNAPIFLVAADTDEHIMFLRDGAPERLVCDFENLYNRSFVVL